MKFRVFFRVYKSYYICIIIKIKKYMLIDAKLTTAQQLIIRHICTIQLQSLERIYNNEANWDESQRLQDVLVLNEIDEEVFEEELLLKISDFKKLKMDPNKLSQMNSEDVSTITHIMTHIADKYKEKYPQAVRNIWAKLFYIQDVKLNYTNN